jgi:hypothetical protein
VVIEMQLRPIAALAEIIHDDFSEAARGDPDSLHRTTVARTSLHVNKEIATGWDIEIRGHLPSCLLPALSMFWSSMS